jgi:putative sigma-54 modulation protein
MQVQVQVKGLPGAARLRRYATERLTAALARVAHAVHDASMRLDDINGPDRGGVDKLCRVVLRLRDNSVLVVEELGADIGRVIDRVTDRLHENVAQHLARLAKFDRATPRGHALPAGTG